MIRSIVLGVGVLAFLAGGCTDGPPSKRYGRQITDAVAGCEDRDGDRRGVGCMDGPDCNDTDPSIWEGCGHCADPAVDCACEPGTLPESCFLEPTEAPDGQLTCHQGTRYCRQGAWSACEDIVSFAEPEAPITNAVIDPDAGPIQCSLCNPICFRITDNLGPLDGGLGSGNSSQVSWADGGGLTLAENPLADPPTPDAGPLDCMLGTAPDRDCDGIDDEFDPYPDDPPFATANPAIFLDIPPGETGVGQIDLEFFLNSADIYFLVDQSASMTDERDALKADLTMGDFIQDPDYECADHDFDGVPDNDLKDDGIIGAIRCFIRDSNFGVGFFREIPFTNYADSKQITYDNYSDITDDYAAVQLAVSRLDTIGNYEWPEASPLALHNLVTGDGMYFGIDKRGIPPRVDCSAGRWGYPCFRESAIPIVLMFTDAMMHNGPPSNNYAYNSSYLGMSVGTDSEYVPIPDGHETFATAYPVGDVTDSLLTFTGSSTNMSEDIRSESLSCLSVDGGTDAVFAFKLSQARDVLLSTRGTRYDTVLGLFSGVPTSGTMLPDSDGSNETTGSAYDLDEVDNEVLFVDGDTAGMDADYDSDTVSCGAATDSPDAVYEFTIDSNATIDIDTDGSALDTVIALYATAPGTTPTYTPVVNTNDDLPTANDLGEIYKAFAHVSGDTSAVGVTNAFNSANIGCGADTAADDAVHKFTLSQGTRVRISTSGSDYDTVVALVGDSCQGGGGGGMGQAPLSENVGGGSSTAASGSVHTFGTGSYIIPMDTTYQDDGMLSAYGLVNALLLEDVPVSWVIQKGKDPGDSDFTASSLDHRTGGAIGSHDYRGGPFVVDVLDANEALPIIDTWQAQIGDATEIHETTADFDGYVRKQLIAAPKIAMLADGFQAVARGYMEAAGIPDDEDTGWDDTCVDMLTPAEVAGPTTISSDDGELFDADGVPAFCQLVTANWAEADALTLTGLEAISEIREFLEEPVHLFAASESVIAIENSVNGRFLTASGLDVGAEPTAWTLNQAELPFAQLDGSFVSASGSFPSYSLPPGDMYRDEDGILIADSGTGLGINDVWLTAFRDGGCSVLNENCDPDGALGLAQGKVSYLGGATYGVATPISSNPGTQGARLFLNSLFDADCTTDFGMPDVDLSIVGPATTMTSSATYTFTYLNDGNGIGHAAELTYEPPSDADFVSATGGAGWDGTTVLWDFGSLSVGETASVTVTVDFQNSGAYDHYGVLDYKQGLTQRRAVTALYTTVYAETPGDLCQVVGETTVAVPTGSENVASAIDLGGLDDNIFQLSGDTTSMDADFTEAYLGCNANDAARDAVFRFSLADTTDVEISSEGTSDFDTVLALVDAPAGVIETHTSDNTNEDTATAQDLGTLDGKIFEVTGSTLGRTPDHDSAEITCGPGSTLSPDVAFKFTLGTATRVRLDTYGSNFDTILSLHDGEIEGSNPVIELSMDQTIEAPPSAYDVAATLDGHVQELTGSTSGMAANFNFPWSCNKWNDDYGSDAVVKFTVGTAGTYELTTDGSDFDTVLGLYPDPAGTGSVPAVAIGSSTTLATAYDIGGLDWRYALSGSTTSNSFNETHCSSTGSADDTFIEFQLPADDSVTFDTYWSSFDTVVSIYKWDDPGHSTYTYVDCDNDGGFWGSSAKTVALTAGDYFAVITGEDAGDDGNFYFNIRGSSVGGDNILACDNNSGTSPDSSISYAFSAGSYYAVVKGYDSGDSGNYQLNLIDPSIVPGSGNSHILDCDDDTGGSQSEIDSVVDLPAGEYWVVVKGADQFEDGDFQLTITDEGNLPPGAVLDCDDDSGSGTTSVITADDLPAGDYWVVLKGNEDADDGAYAVTIRDTSAAEASVIECDNDDGEGDTSVIERNLAAGTYYAVVKGDSPSDEGPYQLSVRDVTNEGYGLIACDESSGPGQTSAITADLTAGDYYIVVKGDEAADADDYTLRVRDNSIPSGDLACNDDGGSYGTSVIQQNLGPGTYYATVKGYDASESGMFQFTVGGADPTTEKYVPPTWPETLTALQANEARVISILSCQDDPYHGDADGDCIAARKQATELANGTDTLGSALEPLVFDIDRDGSGLSKTVVEGIASLSEYLEMNVEVQIVFEWDENPAATPFLVSVVAIPDPSDDCVGVIGNVFQSCKPGASPRFQVLFTNPLDNPVLLNPSDPLGGYNFKAQLIGNGQFLIDEVPIYIIPEDVIDDDPDVPVYEEGQYWQDMQAAGCDPGDNERPDWDAMTWTGVVPEDANITFKACGGDTPEDLDTCTAYTIAQIDGRGACADDSDCPLGYCDTGINICQIATANACTDDTDCASNATCAGSVCAFNSQPVSVGKALEGPSGMAQDNLKPYLRIYVEMSVDDPYDPPPVLYEWSLTYLCTTTE